MKILTKYSIISILKVGLITALIASLMLMGVDLFKNLDNYTTYLIPLDKIITLTLLYFPEAFLLALGPSLLFSVTYFLSNLHASNEIIAIYNGGIKYKSIIKPVVILAFAISLFYFIFNETVTIKTSNMKSNLYSELTNVNDDDTDNYDIALSDMHNSYMVHASRYIASTKTLYNVVLIERTNGGIKRTNAYKAQWSEDSSSWTLYSADIFQASEKYEYNHKEIISDSILSIKPELFKNMSQSISKMSLKLATGYLLKIKKFNPEQYAESGTEFYKRLLGCLTPFVMIIITLGVNYRLKKNVLFFSLIISLCIAVVYYVIQMVTLMLSNQGMIKPYFGMLIPFLAIILISLILSKLSRGKNG